MSQVHAYVVCSSPNKLQLQNVEEGRGCPLNQSSNFLLGSVQMERHNENSLTAGAAVSAEPVFKEAGMNPEV